MKTLTLRLIAGTGAFIVLVLIGVSLWGDNDSIFRTPAPQANPRVGSQTKTSQDALHDLSSQPPPGGTTAPSAEKPPNAPSIYYIAPTYGAAGENITIVGFRFSTTNTVVFDTKSIFDVPIAWWAGIACVQGDPLCHPGVNQALVITVPGDATPGPHSVSVKHENAVSNVVTFTVTR
jgi:hypothetical protein